MCLYLKVHFETHQKCTSLLQLHFSAILIQTFHILCSLWSWTLIHTQTVFQVFAQVCCALGAFCLVKQFYTMAGLHQTHCWFSSYISLPIHPNILPRVYLSCIFWLSSLISNLIPIHLCTNLFDVVRLSIKKK